VTGGTEDMLFPRALNEAPAPTPLLDFLVDAFAAEVGAVAVEEPGGLRVEDVQCALLHAVAAAPSWQLPADWGGQLVWLAGPETLLCVNRLRAEADLRAARALAVLPGFVRSESGTRESARLIEFVAREATGRAWPDSRAGHVVRLMSRWITRSLAEGVVGTGDTQWIQSSRTV
jgi:hypothetical protein